MSAEQSPEIPAHRAVSGDIQLRQGLVALLDECRTRAARREALLAPHLDAGGYVVEDQRAAYDGARITTALEAADWLDDLTARLEQLVAEPPCSVYTLVFGTLGQAPDSFTLYGTDDDALNTLRQLPSFLRWSASRTPADGPGTSTVIEFHGEWTQPHPSAPGHRYDPRAEQTVAAARPAARGALAPASERRAVPPAAGTTPPRRR